jgi:DNA-binding IscR family transcriptional regulator
MKVPKKVDLAVKMIKTLNGPKPRAVSDLVAEVGGTVSFLEQIARRLRAANLIHGQRGPRGGYTSTGTRVTLYDVSLALQYTDQEMSGLDGALASFLKSVVIREATADQLGAQAEAQ